LPDVEHLSHLDNTVDRLVCDMPQDADGMISAFCAWFPQLPGGFDQISCRKNIDRAPVVVFHVEDGFPQVEHDIVGGELPDHVEMDQRNARGR